jgi:hypothetical protein
MTRQTIDKKMDDKKMCRRPLGRFPIFMFIIFLSSLRLTARAYARQLARIQGPSIGLFGVARVFRFCAKTDSSGLYDFQISPLLEPRSTVTTNRRNHKVQWENTTRYF